ncbi:MAG TPA: CBS domain-containing protein [Steroidobacteraceae bacterium]|nr:CBS domain-containing protein [Steroidobacteraceae bacterium]
MNTGKLCRSSAVTVGREDELIKAAQLMREKHIGYLVVVASEAADGLERPVGVLTDRDIVVTVVARETDPRTLRVGDVMTPSPVSALESDPLEKSLREMRRMGVRRLPVVGRRGELLGVLSLDDVIEALSNELQNVAGSIRNERVIEGTLRP